MAISQIRFFTEISSELEFCTPLMSCVLTDLLLNPWRDVTEITNCIFQVKDLTSFISIEMLAYA